MENKASIESVTSLHKALENIESVKRLDRTGHGKNYVLIGSQQGTKLNPNEFQHQVFAAILTEASLSTQTLTEELLKYLRSNPNRNYWPNFYADVRHFSICYLKSINPAILTVIPSEAQYIAVLDNTIENLNPPLLELAKEVLSFLRVYPLVDYHPGDYLWANTGKIEYHKI